LCGSIDLPFWESASESGSIADASKLCVVATSFFSGEKPCVFEATGGEACATGNSSLRYRLSSLAKIVLMQANLVVAGGAHCQKVRICDSYGCTF